MPAGYGHALKFMILTGFRIEKNEWGGFESASSKIHK